MQKFILSSLIALCFTSAAQAQVSVKDAWVRATVTQQKVTGAFMQLHSAQNARLIEARSPVAATVELHQMEMVGNVMEMRAIDGLDLPAGKIVELSPGAYHLMLMGLKAQVRAGDIIPISLVIEGKDKQRKTFEVKAIARPLHQVRGDSMPGH
ncbi:MAG: copper chaperone PCu(A)C [Burkholderiaceae bacterium]